LAEDIAHLAHPSKAGCGGTPERCAIRTIGLQDRAAAWLILSHAPRRRSSQKQQTAAGSSSSAATRMKYCRTSSSSGRSVWRDSVPGQDRPRRCGARLPPRPSRPSNRRGSSPRPRACPQGCCAWPAAVRHQRCGAWRSAKTMARRRKVHEPHAPTLLAKRQNINVSS
jgi:hypothetical protein